MTRSHARSAALVATASALVACSAIIGTRDLTFATADGGGAGDGSVEDGEPPDGAPSDEATPGDDAGGCKADVTKDALNCGRCGHSCLGGTCVSGACTAFPIVQGQAAPKGMTIDANNVYWVNFEPDQVMKATKEGKNVTVLSQGFADGGVTSYPFDVAVDDTYVYWVNYQSDTTGRIGRCPIAGCGGNGIVLVNNLTGPSDLAVDSTSVYWVENTGDAIGRANKDGGAKGVIARTSTYAQGITIDDTSVYFTADGLIGKTAKNVAASDAGPQFQALYSSANMYPFGIKVDATNVYWTVNDNPGQVFTMPKNGLTDGGTPRAIASGLPYSLALALDTTSVYWVNVGPDSGTDPNNPIFADGTVMTCLKTGCPSTGPIVLASKQTWVQDIEVDDTAIYWTNRGSSGLDGAIMKIAK